MALAQLSYVWEADCLSLSPQFCLNWHLSDQSELHSMRQRRRSRASKYNQRHAAKELSNLLPGDQVYIPDRGENAVVVRKTPEPRSYLIETNSNAAVRTNWRQLNLSPMDTAVPPGEVPQIPAVNPPRQALGEVEKARESVLKPISEIAATSTRSGRRAIPPKRLGLKTHTSSQLYL